MEPDSGPGGSRSNLLQPAVEFRFSVLAGVAILLLEQADELVSLAGDPIQVVGQFGPSWPPLRLHFFFTSKDTRFAFGKLSVKC
jgi:hypothetical protein